MTEPDYYDAKIAGWWGGLSAWIETGGVMWNVMAVMLVPVTAPPEQGERRGARSMLSPEMPAPTRARRKAWKA